jgi:phosphatidylserine decarboxylase
MTPLDRATESLNFVLTNRLPRALATRFMGWFSRLEQPWVRAPSLALWQALSDLDLSDAKRRTFTSIHDCFTRELTPGARPVDADPGVIASPCDAIVGACGSLDGVTALQAKGAAYSIEDLLGSRELAERYRDGCYATLRLTPTMYHRFHAPYRCRVQRVTYISGDVWNVNPPTLARIDQLFCRNERAVIEARIEGARNDAHAERKARETETDCITLVAVAAILVASIRLTFVDVRLHLRYRGPNVIECDATLDKGDEMGWFEHGSTILVFAPRGYALCDGVAPGARLRAGRRLMNRPLAAESGR